MSGNNPRNPGSDPWIKPGARATRPQLRAGRGEERRVLAAQGAESLAVGDVLSGVAGSPGTITGTARIVLDPTDPGDLGPGDIMVAPLTDPAWTPLFMAADGVVVNVGGQISHAIIVSRELGLPCVVSATDATVRIPDGATIRVDGSSGEVTVISLP